VIGASAGGVETLEHGVGRFPPTSRRRSASCLA